VTALGVENDMVHIGTIKLRGTSAHQQIRRYNRLRKEGHAHKRALREVAKWLQLCSENGSFVEDGNTANAA
jgi:hypothetical protein